MDAVFVHYINIHTYVYLSTDLCIYSLVYIYYIPQNRYGSLLVTWETADLCIPSTLVRLVPHIRSLCFGLSSKVDRGKIQPVSSLSIGGTHFKF